MKFNIRFHHGTCDVCKERFQYVVNFGYGSPASFRVCEWCIADADARMTVRRESSDKDPMAGDRSLMWCNRIHSSVRRNSNACSCFKAAPGHFMMQKHPNVLEICFNCKMVSLQPEVKR